MQEAQRLGGEGRAAADPQAAVEEAVAASLQTMGEAYVGVKHTQVGGQLGRRHSYCTLTAAPCLVACEQRTQVPAALRSRLPSDLTCSASFSLQAVAALSVAPAYLVLDFSHVRGLDATGARTMGVVHRWGGGRGRFYCCWCCRRRCCLFLCPER